METGEIEISPDVMRKMRALAKTKGLRWNDSWFFDVPKGSPRRAA
jgi:hypothetical protein